MDLVSSTCWTKAEEEDFNGKELNFISLEKFQLLLRLAENKWAPEVSDLSWQAAVFSGDSGCSQLPHSVTSLDNFLKATVPVLEVSLPKDQV